MSKALYFADKNLNAMPFSREEVLLKKSNHWKDWHCAAGTENIHITADGNVFGATCKVGGLLANIYDHFAVFPRYWLRCSKEACACGSDMQIRKVKNFEQIEIAEKLKASDLNFQESNIGETEFVGSMYDFEPRLTCTWDLGRRCNYSCDYCNSSISNNFESHKSKGSLEFGFANIRQSFLKGQRAKFIFTGGEPTINPAYLDFVKMIRSEGHLVHTQTNGSLTPEYYGELIKHSFIGISIHLKFFNQERLFRNIEAILQAKLSDQQYQYQWFGVRIMAVPGQVQQAVKLHDDLQALKLKIGSDFDLQISPIYEKNNENKIQIYDKEEAGLLAKFV
jgi:organic radical activating enzyme